MAITTGSITSATPATALYNVIAPLLTAKGWTHIATKTAATCGTSAAQEVWVDSTTTSVSNVYTGCILLLEPDDTNARLRMRVMEVFDNGATGSPATNAKWYPPNDAPGASLTPTSDYHRNAGFVAIGEALAGGSSATVNAPAFTQVSCPASVSFNYWTGADTTRLLVATQTSGPQWMLAGYIEYLGSAGGTGAVFIAGRAIQGASISWDIVAGQNLSAKCSREPLRTTSLLTAFGFQIGPSFVHNNSTTTGGSGVSPASGWISLPHHWHTVMVTSPAFLHGVGNDTVQSTLYWDGGRSHLAKLSNFIVFMDGGTESTIGDTLTISGIQYTVLGRAGNLQNSSNGWFDLAVQTSAF